MHCQNFTVQRCDRCFNGTTQQKKTDDIDISPQVESYYVNGNDIHVTWNNEHTSIYDISWILNQQHAEKRPPGILWTGDNIEKELPSVTCTDDTLTSNCVETLVKSLLQFGVGLVKNVTPTVQATERIVDYIGPRMHTHYGPMWEIKTDLFEEYKDTAYTKDTLAVHTDNTYFIEPAGWLMFHCLKAAEEGGETFLVDSFKAAQLLKEQNTKAFDLLKTPLEWQYISDQFNFKCVSPIINMHKDKNELEQIRFNIYDRSARVPFHTTDLESFYQSLKHFRDILMNPALHWRIKLSPGTVLFVNNWRVMHGRTRFSGTRRIIGCYLLMNTVLSKARMLKIIE